MNLTHILEQLLQSGRSQVDQASRSGDLGKYAKGAAAGGLLGMLLGSRGGRGLGGKTLQIGTVAALGTMAWRAYSEWQAKQQAGAPAAAAGAPQASPASALPARFDTLPATQLEDHSRAMLKAMIAAAKSDGHFDERESGLVRAELQRLNADPAEQQWVEQELRLAVDPADVARASTSPQMAAEMYLASVLVVDDKTTMERAYLDELAKQLKLPADLKADLEAKAKADAAAGA